DLRQIRPDVPQGLADALATALAKRPNERYASMAQFAKVLRVHTIPIAGSATELGISLPPAPPPSAAAPRPTPTYAPPPPPAQRAPSPSNRPARPASPPSRPATPIEQQQELPEAEVAYEAPSSSDPSDDKALGVGWPLLAGAASLVVILIVALCIVLLKPSKDVSVIPDTPATPQPSVPPPAPKSTLLQPVISQPKPPAPPPPAPVVTLPLGDFQDQTDIGMPRHRGYVEFSFPDHRYTVSGSGDDIYGKSDMFHFVWREVEGDASLQAEVAMVGTNKQNSRKACLMFRQNLGAGSPVADVAVHGNGLIAIQFRPHEGYTTSQKTLSIKNPVILKLSRKGDEFTLFAAKKGEPFKSVGSVTVPMKGKIYAGLAVCSHDPDVMDTAVFSHVLFTPGSP
ncbi:MAG TPA: hypothetical protein VLJ39_15000, partial [Tepidisphaeraceae bacterium]|nr:hypothetical protein [Tepidisphaeraceae bacterium]